MNIRKEVLFLAEERKIGTIRDELRQTEDSGLEAFIRSYGRDERAGVRALLAQAA